MVPDSGGGPFGARVATGRTLTDLPPERQQRHEDFKRELRAVWLGAVLFWIAWVSGAVVATLLFGVIFWVILGFDTVFQPFTTLLRVGLQGKAAPEQEKKPANLTFLVDVSGSMQSNDKLPLVQQVLRQTLDLLEPEDTVSIASYASDTRVRLEPTRVAERARTRHSVSAALPWTGSWT